MPTANKHTSRAVLEERLRVLEDARTKRRMFMVTFGVYFAMLLGVLTSQAIVMHDNLNAVLEPLELGQLGGGILVAGALYNKIEQSDKNDFIGMSKKGNIFRVLRVAFYHGLTWMTMLGAWW